MGGYLQGEVTTTYKNLVSKLGRQNETTDKYKVDAEWLIMTPVGHATIYNYKDGKNYNGREGLAIKDITNWHIGGQNPEVVDYVKRFLLD